RKTCTRWPKRTRRSLITAGSWPHGDPSEEVEGPDGASSTRDGETRTRRGEGPDHPGIPARPHAEHRDHGPHRRGQDDDPRTDPVIQRQVLQGGGGRRWTRADGLSGYGAGAAAALS